jgi:dimethylargininase
MLRAVVRGVPSTFDRALAAVPAPIDVDRARAMHAAYRGALISLGVAPIDVDADDRYPDCVFVEDTAVVAGGVALITRPGAPERRGEVDAIATVLGAVFELATMTAPATLDGGDVMRVGQTIYVGRSARTNDAGIARLAAVFEPRGYRVVAIDLAADILHLKCACAPLGDDRMLLARGTIPADRFDAKRIVWVTEDEAYAANALAIGDAALVADGFPRTRDALASAGFRTIAIDTTQARHADGALTCMSIVF